MDNIFKGIMPNPYPLRTKYGYGYLSDKRKILRYFRKYGFDISETWNLDETIAQWLSDNVGGFFRDCGRTSAWSEYDLDGNPVSYNEETVALEKARKNEYLKQLHNYLTTCSGENYLKFLEFIIPRLIYLVDHAYGYPDEFNTFKDWQNMLKSIVVELSKRDIAKFVSNFYSLWD